ncbi:RWD-domain-containing protein [Fragilariopsis cylindrus CCMP1102]|uniref:RWD-domain-containing protein n=1 Tax=Fragilariopsis cylindrus CCMP1102 TaxID=635003 RepID=A0A1E7FVP3_9STRA|nr:RWD-domain-containing protein [Fragilariopsis cylindrus CCMP1102]|eukprot:OEU22194.1 RWD-domain-containing protein [Fragilariopsis cylindrus CCMP1102]
MSDDLCEEQEMEAEALAAIFDDCLEVISSTQPFKWAVNLWPEQHTVEGEEGDDNDPDAPQNHVGIKVTAKIPLSYPEESLPEFNIKILKGLTEEHEQELLELAMEEAESNRGMPVMYTVCERLREWLLENNQKGMDDRSMYTQMIKREKEKEREENKAKQIYESQKKTEIMSAAESEELAVRKRRAEGTPCTDDSFSEWAKRFSIEMKEEAERLAAETAVDPKKKGGKGAEKVVDKSGRLTGHQQFTDKGGNFNLEAMEAAAENAERDENEVEDIIWKNSLGS